MDPTTLLEQERSRKGRGAKITVVSYDGTAVEKTSAADMGSALEWIGRRRVTWILVQGKLEMDELMVLQKWGGLHPLVIDEIAEEGPSRPKLMDLQGVIFLTWRLLLLEGLEVKEERAVCLLGKGFLITIVPPGVRMDKTMDALGNEHNEIRSMGTDYLLYDIIDSVIDDYFSISEEMGDLIEDAQDSILNDSGTEALANVQGLRRALIKVRKAIWPLREIINALVKGQSDLVDAYTAPYYRDAYEHTIELMDTVDTHRDMVSEMLDMYQSMVSNQLNKIVKVLTLISVIFAPLTFIVGLYGMNFVHMPELSSPYSYPAVLVIMLVLAILMLLIFRRKGWF